MKMGGVLFLIILSMKAHSATEKTVHFGTFYETNTFLANDTSESDFAFFIKPNLLWDKNVSSSYQLSTDSALSYTKYMSNSNQDFFAYDLNLKNNFKFTQRFSMFFTPEIKLLSEPAHTATSDRLERQYMGAQVGFTYYKDERRHILFNLEYQQESLSESNYEFLNNQSAEARLYYKKYFLPETYFYYGARFGMRQFPDGLDSPVNRDKYDSMRIEPGFGVEGRLTRYFKVRSYIGYGLIEYKQDISFRDLVYLIEFEEEISPKDLIVLGLENAAEDSYYTNFLTTQKIYLGYGRFIGDQVLLSTKVEYAYRSFSRPNRRDDQRLALDARMEYSYSQKLKIETQLLIDDLSSDSENPDGPPPPIDRAVSYTNWKLGIAGKYLF